MVLQKLQDTVGMIFVVQVYYTNMSDSAKGGHFFMNLHYIIVIIYLATAKTARIKTIEIDNLDINVQ